MGEVVAVGGYLGGAVVAHLWSYHSQPDLVVLELWVVLEAAYFGVTEVQKAYHQKGVHY